MKIKTSELTGAALDWAVAEVEGTRVVISGAGKYQKVSYIKEVAKEIIHEHWETFCKIRTLHALSCSSN